MRHWDLVEWFLAVCAALLIGVLLLLVGLVVHELTRARVYEGIIVGKGYRGAYTSIVPSGKVMIPVYHPESWSVEINGTAPNGAMQNDSWSVSEDTWKAVKQGDKFKVPR